MIGLINIALFHYAIFRLWFFLNDSSGRLQSDSLVFTLAIDALLLAFFSLPHSFLLDSKVKVKLLRYIPKSLYSTIYSLHACLGIILMDSFWVSFGPSLIDFSVGGELLISAFYWISWIGMFWSMVATGLFRQSGIEEWWLTLKGKKIKNNLLHNGPYQICRHPIYASFLGMIWFSSHVSIDRLFLAFAWTAYIFIGASLKERRLLRNKKYKEYSESTPAFPFLPKSIDQFFMTKVWGLK
tara:strand:+ start:122172 stop:122891 length:720 start_codon:yes stop_codon:yes gene_type:complete